MSYVLFGGLFDPPHLGHMEIAGAACRELNCEKLIWIPSMTPPHRRVEGVGAEERLQMLRELTACRDRQEVSEIELDPGHSGYTVETVERISAENPGKELYLLIGSDEAENFKTWKDWEKILLMTHLAVAARKSGISLSPEIFRRSVILHNRVISISSREIRRKLRSGEPVSEYLDPRIEHWIRRRALYLDAE